MDDLAFLAGAVAFFTIALAYVGACERLLERKSWALSKQ
jgi:hypothetical protein